MANKDNSVGLRSVSQDEMQLKDDKSESQPADHVVEPSIQDDLEKKLRHAHELSQDGYIEKANSIYEETLESLDPAHADSHDVIVECLWNVANNLYVHSSIEECIPIFKRLISAQEEKHGLEDGVLITPLLRLAIALKRAGEAEESEAVFERSMRLAKQVNPEGNLNVADGVIKKKPPGSATRNVDLAPQAEASTTTTEASDSAATATSEAAAVDEQTSESKDGLLDFSADGDTPPVADAAEPGTAKPSSSESDMLKYLFSDNAPNQAPTRFETETTLGEVERTGRNSTLRSRGAQPRESYGFVDRNPASTRLSEMDMAALGAIPSPDAMKTMFRDAPFSDVGARTKAAAFLKTNESTDEPVKFAPGVKNFDAKQSTPFMVRHKRLIPILVATAIVFAALFVAKTMMDKSTIMSNYKSPSSADQTPLRTFASFDQQTVLKTYKDSWASYTSDGKSHRSKYHFLDGDPRDFFIVIPGSFSGKDIWMVQTADGLKQADGAALYSPDAQLTAVIKEMTTLAQRAQDYYRVMHSYPTSPEQFQSAVGTSYINPFTHKGDTPKFFPTYSSSIGTSAAKLAAKTEAGENWINESSIGPGEIHCCSLIYQDPAGTPASNIVNTATASSSGTGTDFFIRGGDRDGQFIPGGKPGLFFYIVLNQGKSSELDTIKNGPEKPLDLGKTRILIAKDGGEQAFFMFLAGAIPAVMLMGIGACWLIQHQLYEEKDAVSVARKAVVSRLLIVFCVALGLWIALCALV